MRTLKRVLLSVFLGGWVFPALVAWYFSAQARRQAAGLDPIASFPFDRAALQLGAVAAAWLGVALLYAVWSLKRRAAELNR